MAWKPNVNVFHMFLFFDLMNKSGSKDEIPKNYGWHSENQLEVFPAARLRMVKLRLVAQRSLEVNPFVLDPFVIFCPKSSVLIQMPGRDSDTSPIAEGNGTSWVKKNPSSFFPCQRQW